MKFETTRVGIPDDSGKYASGFALVATLALMILLTMVAVGLLSLSAISLRSSSQGSAQSTAQANARLALMIALGELQKEMGPDSRVSAEAALFDSNVQTAAMDGIAQSRWLASYNAWGNWLNASYTLPDSQGSLTIGDTYGPRRERMFRRWLLSVPQNTENDIAAPNSLSNWNNTNSVIMVGEGSLGKTASSSNPDQVTRAYLTRIGTTGKHAWWVGPENHRAKINTGGTPRNLAAHQWETSQGDTAEVAVSALPGMQSLDAQPALRNRVLTAATLRPTGITEETVKGNFFDLTAHSQGVLASVRSGHLKKDLSLLFENDNEKLPAPYRFNPGRDVREPSIRPMSPDLTAKKPRLPNRHFQSWTNMRHFYRSYRNGSDATVGGVGGPGVLTWSGSKPHTKMVSSSNLGSVGTGTGGADWDGSNNYWRVPILAKITFIYSLITEPDTTQSGKFKCYHVYSPVFTFWNPYNVEMRIPDNKLDYLTSAYKIWPNSGTFWVGNTLMKDADAMGAFGQMGYSQGVVTRSYLRSGGRGDIIFKPGEFRVFSLASRIEDGNQASAADLMPGFNPSAIGGEKKLYGSYTKEENPGITVEFSHNYWGGNINNGNTCGSLCMVASWDRAGSNGGSIPINYAIDWLNKQERRTPITPPGASNIARWVFDGQPNPVSFCQLVIKGLSEFDYQSIDWERDWRCRNWIQAPPFYFGSGLYMSEDTTIAHTQRLDCPYVVFFGPMSMSEMPKVVFHDGPRAFLGSGTNPFEKVSSVPALELPTAPVSSIAGFAGMRINPGWTRADTIGVDDSGRQAFFPGGYGGNGSQSTGEESLYCADTKRVNYQSGVTGPGIGNSFMHPMLSRTDVYRYLDNSKSEDMPNREQPENTNRNDSMAYNDYWDHALLLNDALWDDYFVSSLADQARPGAGSSASLNANIDRLVAGDEIPNSRYRFRATAATTAEAKTELQAADGYLKAAKHLMVDGMFNVNSTSVPAWFSLFTGIRERQLVYRDSSGSLRTIDTPTGKIAISRFNTEVTDKEMDNPETGVGLAWSGVRYLDDDQLMNLAEECVKQVKQRGPFLNFSEFINRRLSSDKLGLMGALQSAIDYDDGNPDSKSINYRYKNGPNFMLKKAAFGRNSFSTTDAAEGSRFAGIPGYVIQSDLLKPIANTLSVRDDTFRIRAYGETLDAGGKVIARAWCEAVVQRLPEYLDSANPAEEPARLLRSDGAFEDNTQLVETNRRFGRRFHIVDFRWLNSNEV